MTTNGIPCNGGNPVRLPATQSTGATAAAVTHVSTAATTPAMAADARVAATATAAEGPSPLGEFDRLFNLPAEPADPTGKAQWLHKGWETYRQGTTFQHELPREFMSETEARLWKMKRTLEKADPQGSVRDHVVKENLLKPMTYFLQGATFAQEPNEYPGGREAWLKDAHDLVVQTGGARTLVAQLKEAFPAADYRAVDAADAAFKAFETKVRHVATSP